MPDRELATVDEGPAALVGLDNDEVERRHQAGLGNLIDEPSSRSTRGIIRANLLTRFNAIVSAMVAVVLVFGDPIDAAFGGVMVLNAMIGVVQELRAKRSLDALRVLVAPSIGVIRGGVAGRTDPRDLVQGDVITLEPGDQIPVDAIVTHSRGLEVDESLLTGEWEPVTKPVEAELLSGSFVVAGSAVATATRVGGDSWVQQLTREAKTFTLTESELRVGVDRLLTVASWILPPLAALLFWSQLRSSASIASGLVWAVAGVVALVPQGLVLLVSMALAVAVIRLGRQKVIVQELPAVEGLARIDVLCIDKTGTLTTGRLTVDSVEVLTEPDDGIDPRAGLAALARLEVAGSASMDAIRDSLDDLKPDGDGRDWAVTAEVPFSSVRKWSGASFAEAGTWIIGAPEILFDAMPYDHVVGPDGEEWPVNIGEAGLAVQRAAMRVRELTGQARRVLLVATTSAAFETGSSDEVGDDGHRLPPGLRPVILISLKEEVRTDAADTMAYFARQGVDIKVVSGDNPRTVAAVANEIGIGSSESYVDLRSIENLEQIPPDTTVFGRVRPEQKRDLVRLLQARGRTVAMTGDGVNDIPALKAADIGIAMNTATQATKATAQLVLLDGRFDRLPGVVSEGRRVIANMERVSSLFVTKTVYAAVLALAVGVAGVPFPFLPRHLTVIATVTIGIPAFILSFRSTDEPCRPGYLRRVVRFALPAGSTAGLATLATYWLVRSGLGDATLDQARASSTIALTAIGLWALARLVWPLDWLEGVLLVALMVGFATMFIPSPLSDVYALRPPPMRHAIITAGVVAAFVTLAQVALAVEARWGPATRSEAGAARRRT